MQCSTHLESLAWLLVSVPVGRGSGVMQHVSNLPNSLFRLISVLMNRQKAGCSELQTTELWQLRC